MSGYILPFSSLYLSLFVSSAAAAIVLFLPIIYLSLISCADCFWSWQLVFDGRVVVGFWPQGSGLCVSPSTVLSAWASQLLRILYGGETLSTNLMWQPPSAVGESGTELGELCSAVLLILRLAVSGSWCDISPTAFLSPLFCNYDTLRNIDDGSCRGDDLTQGTKANKVHKLQIGMCGWSKHCSALSCNSSFAHHDWVVFLLAAASVTIAKITMQKSAVN